MAWKGQEPPADDVICNFEVYTDEPGRARRFEVDRLPDGRYRFTTGDLFGFEELFIIDGAEEALECMAGLTACTSLGALRGFVGAQIEELSRKAG